MTSDPDPAPARMVGDYTLLAKIGEGGMGVVHLARRPGGDRVALKVLRPHIVGDDEARRRLAREVSSLQRIRSRWIAEIVDADPWGPVPYVATRYVPGLSLHDHVHQEGPIEGRDLTWFAGCLAEGLASVHAVGVLHRDVKPSNVLMEGRTPILIDFGLARVADDPRLTHTGWLLGTPGYLAPEILYGEDATPASDVHSWAATVAFAAIGEAPFGRGPSMAIMDRVRRGEFDLGDWTGPLADVVAAALDPAPTERPTLQEILAWLRPQTTQPGPLLGAPPSGPFGPVGPTPDLFDDALAVAALAHGDPPLVPPVPPAPTLVEGPASTRVLPDEVTRRDPAPYAPTQRQLGPPPVYRAQPSVAPPVWWDDAPPGFVFPEAEPRAPWPERLRRGAVVLAGSLAVGAACALAPWVALAVVVTLTWLLRSGSLAASGVADRRELRGRRWYDGLQLLVHAPWLLVASVPGTGMLVLWSAGLAAAAGLLCYAVTAPLEVSLFLSGVVLALATWWGPGSDRLRSPLNRLVVPAARRAGPAWLVTVGALLLFAASVWLYVSAQGISWMPGSSRPFG